MHHHYNDIRSRIAEEPKWWDENAVPRYSTPDPNESADVYADEVAFVEIACQSCSKIFLVAFSWGVNMGWNKDGSSWVKTFEPMTLERARRLHYGDPPNAGCCDVGPTMNSEPKCIREFWRCLKGKWERVPELEIVLDGEAHLDLGTTP